MRPRASGFNPKSIAGLSGWWDASDASTVTLNGSTVSEWRDKSGNARSMTQATASNQPAYTANSFGTKSAITLAASSTNRLDTSAYMDALGDDTARTITIFAVLKCASATLSGKTIGETDNPSGFGWYHRFTDGNSYFDAGNQANARTTGAVSSAAFTGGAIYVGKRDSGDVRQWVNNALIAGNVSNATGAIKTGSYVFSIRGVNVQLTYAEILTFRTALTDANRSAVQKYLGTKWGIVLS